MVTKKPCHDRIVRLILFHRDTEKPSVNYDEAVEEAPVFWLDRFEDEHAG